MKDITSHGSGLFGGHKTSKVNIRKIQEKALKKVLETLENENIVLCENLQIFCTPVKQNLVRIIIHNLKTKTKKVIYKYLEIGCAVVIFFGALQGQEANKSIDYHNSPIIEPIIQLTGGKQADGWQPRSNPIRNPRTPKDESENRFKAIQNGQNTAASSGSDSPDNPDDNNSDDETCPKNLEFWKLKESNEMKEMIYQTEQSHKRLIDETDSESESESETEDEFIMTWKEALAIIKAKYGSNGLAIENDLRMSDWQSAKKVKHVGCFGLDPENFGFSQAQANEIDKDGLVDYVRRGYELPSLEFIKAYQNAVKRFCENSKSIRDDNSTFNWEPSVTFYNPDTQQAAIFDRETKEFITGYILSPSNATKYKDNGNIGTIGKKS